VLPGKAGHSLGIVGRGHVEFALENLADALLAFVDDRGDDMAGRFVVELQDVFAQVGFDGFDAVSFQGLIQPNLFGDHAFAFGDALDLMLLSDVQDQLASFGGIDGP
jgi:hypothetical protein